MPDTFAYVPSQASSVRVTPRTLRVQFGDGYMQEFADGINSVLQAWEIVFEPIGTDNTNPSVDDLDNFFAAQGGYKKFLWTPPKPLDVQGYYICREWSWAYDQGKLCSFRATFEQRPP